MSCFSGYMPTSSKEALLYILYSIIRNVKLKVFLGILSKALKICSNPTEPERNLIPHFQEYARYKL